MKAVPKELRASTPLYFFATAGLRLLPGNQAEELLEEVRSLMKKYPFNTKIVEIMKGEDEGSLQWLSINFLHGAVSLSQKNSVPAVPVAVVDLGGGSVQMAYRMEKDVVD